MPFHEDATLTGYQNVITPTVDYDPDFISEVLPAAFATENVIGSLKSSGIIRDAFTQDPVRDPNIEFDPFDFVRPEDMDEHLDEYGHAENMGDVWRLQRRLDKEREHRSVLASSGAAGVGAGIIAGVIDPTVLLPGGAVYRSFGLTRNILKSGASVGLAGAVGMTAQEALLHSTQLERTLGESAMNITAGTIFAGLMGGAVGATAHAMSKRVGGVARTDDDIIAQMDNDFSTPVGTGGVGAARVRDLDDVTRQQISDELDRLVAEGKLDRADVDKEMANRVSEILLQQEGIKTNWAVKAVTETTGKFSPELRTMTSPSIETRALAPELVSSTGTLARNAQGRATPESAEAITLDWRGKLIVPLKNLDDQFVRYVKGRSKRFGDVAGIAVENFVKRDNRKMTRPEFNRAVGRAMIRADDASSLDGVPAEAVPFINAAAARFRADIIDPMTKRAIELELLPEDVSVDTAASYFMRVYDIDKLTGSTAHRTQFIETTKNWLIRRQKEAEGRTKTFDSEVETLRGNLKNIRRKIKAVGEGVRKGTFKGAAKETEEATNAAVDALQDRLIISIDTAAERMKFDDNAKKAAASTFFKTLKKNIQETVDDAVGVVVERDATAALDDLLAKAEGLLDDELLPIIRDDLSAVSKEVASEAAGEALPDAIIRGVDEASVKAQKAFERSLKSQEANLKKLLTDPKARSAKALRDIQKNIVKTARKEADTAARAATKELRKGLQKQIKELAQRRKLHTRDLADVEKLELEFSDIAEQILGRIVGTPAGRLPYDVAPQKINGSPPNGRSGLATPLHKRVFGIEDELIEDFLVQDVEEVMKRYVRSMSSDLALVEKFGTVEMVDQISKINDDYARLARGVTSDKDLQKLQKQKDRDIRDIVAMRERLQGTHGLSDDPSGWAARAGRGVLQFNYITKLGGMTISALSDLARPVMVHGITRIVGDGLSPLFTEFKNFGRVTQEIRDMGIADDMVMNSRLNNLSDIIEDSYTRGSRFERTLSGVSNTFGMVTLMAPWNTALKQFATAVTMTRTIRALRAEAAGVISKKEAEFLRASLISKEDGADILKQIEKHGQMEGKMELPRVPEWDEEAARVARVFRSSLRRAADQIVITPGIGDRPLFATGSVTGRVITQFKSFAFAANSRILVSGLQQADMAFLSGVTLSVFLGMMSSGFKMWDAGRGDELKDWSLSKWVVEGVDRSGVTGVLSDGNNILEKVTRGTVGFAPLTGGQQASRYASRNWVGAVLGPTFGTAVTVGGVVGNTAAAVFGDDQIKESDIHAARRLLPYNNLILFRQAISSLEEGVGDSFGLQ